MILATLRSIKRPKLFLKSVSLRFVSEGLHQGTMAILTHMKAKEMKEPGINYAMMDSGLWTQSWQISADLWKAYGYDIY